MEEKKKKHGISLMANEIAEEIKNIDGLCTKRFKADIITNGIDYRTLAVGDVIKTDKTFCIFSTDGQKYEGKQIVITKVGKPCFPECPLPKEQRPCILNKNVAFAEEYKE